MENATVRQFVVTSRDQVPENFVPLVDFGPPNKKGNGTPEYTAIQAAWSDGTISGCKWYRSPGDKFGPVFVDKAHAAKVVQSLRDEKATAEQASTQATAALTAADQLQLVGVLRSMLFELRRIGDTMEAYAKRGAVEEWQTTNG